MTHSTCNRNLLRLSGTLLACASVLAAPIALAQSWSPIQTPGQGGSVRNLVVPAQFSSTLVGDSWAAIEYGGMYRQAAGSSTWTAMNNGLTDRRVFSFAVNTGVSPYRGYAVTRGGGVFRTTDGGANWAPVNTGLGCLYARVIAAVFGASASADKLLVTTECASSGGVYMSINGGASWAATSGMSAGVVARGVTRVFPSGVSPAIDFWVVGTNQGVYKSTDGGLTWTLSNGAITGPNGPVVYSLTYSYSAANGVTLVATVEGSGVWKSTDQGVSWGTAPVLSKIPNGSILVDRDGNFYLTTEGDGVYRSTDNGTTWTQWVTSATLPGAVFIYRSSIVSASPIFYARTYAGIYQSTDNGVSWTKTSLGLPGGYAVNTAWDTNGNGYAAFAEGVYQKTPASTAWQRMGGSNLGSFWKGGHITVTPADVLYAITSDLGVFKFDGANWVAMNTGLPNMVSQGGRLRVDPKNTNGLYLGLATRGIYYSAYGGTTWTAINNGLAGNALHIRDVWVTASFAVIATDGGIYKSTDGGANWAKLPFTAMSPGSVELPADHVVIDPTNGNIYAAVYQADALGTTYPASGVWKSADGGATWTQSLAGKRAHEIKVTRTAAGVTLYAGVWDDGTTLGGAFQSTDEAATWTAINTGLTNNYISSFSVPPTTNVLKAVATLGDGVFIFTAPQTLSLISGWNLLGNGMGTTLTVANAFGDATKVTTVWKWLAASNNWAFYTPTQTDGGAAYAAGKGYAFLTSVAGGEGFWVNAKAAFTVPLAGTPVTSVSFQMMASGWNLIATGDGPTPSAFNRAMGTTPPSPGVVPINLTTLWAWDAAQTNWYFYAPSLEANGGLAAYITSKSYLDFGAKTLDPVTGFWVNKP